MKVLEIFLQLITPLCKDPHHGRILYLDVTVFYLILCEIFHIFWQFAPNQVRSVRFYLLCIFHGLNIFVILKSFGSSFRLLSVQRLCKFLHFYCSFFVKQFFEQIFDFYPKQVSYSLFCVWFLIHYPFLRQVYQIIHKFHDFIVVSACIRVWKFDFTSKNKIVFVAS